ncbi:aspartate oxidase [Desulfosporosinus orientis DSM 765]|uniref:Aspartate oxidase n=1 Tax=Desulfosporosinus orientis (strain ATCC 19365 / DSM 765 / NCIMB 8382 / VKM B-1628 / Singapore I) TaxID=768706 RepID=G7WEY9_DESOD|nr:FAD-dependent oxidoreductase [Desulfosporosinus orientis]AET67318.1 aspartate oxidase [Desulfosporosinus orientis DSM 765]
MVMELQQYFTDVLIIGAGLAGLSAAVEAAGAGKRVMIACKGRVGRSGNTVITQNNMAVVWDALRTNDSIEGHIEDTLIGGGHLNDPDLVQVLAAEAAESIGWLMEHGVRFQRDKEDLLIKGSPGHTRFRIIRAVGVTKSNRTLGLALSVPLAEKAEALGAEFLERILIVSLLVEEGRVCGAIGLDRNKAGLSLICAGSVIIAGGGAGGLFQLSTNVPDVCGDSYALGYQAGAAVRDLEFIQFHPAVTVSTPRLVFSTSPFADGAVFRNRHGEAYMKRYSPQGDMATRDIMARANFKEIAEDRGTEGGGVIADFSAVPAEVMTRNYPDICGALQGSTMIEVAPAQHFMNGGIAMDSECRSSIPGLWVCGEAAGGLHGANRLAGNALTEAAVFGRRAGRLAANGCKQSRSVWSVSLIENYLKERYGRWADLGISADLTPTNSWSELKQELKQCMSLYAGVVRTEKGLGKAKGNLLSISDRLTNWPFKSYGDLLRYCELKMMLLAANLIINACLKRPVSMGSHYRED